MFRELRFADSNLFTSFAHVFSHFLYLPASCLRFSSGTSVQKVVQSAERRSSSNYLSLVPRFRTVVRM